MRQLIINFVALLVIGLGAYHLSGVQTANAAVNNQITTMATCDCEDEDGGSTCSGDKCACSGSKCTSCDNSWLGLKQCDLPTAN